jgi:1-acyl-sn-glycerol-3-phosphate acyltransferase
MTLQRAVYAALRLYVRLGLRFYYKRILIYGEENIPDGPVIFAANHQNAFMDALMIVCFNSHQTHCLTRADVFKGPFIGWMLRVLNMIPIYRIRDGAESLSKNQQTFDRCTELFMTNHAVVIFPEGNHGNKKRLRPLSKGFTRLAFEAIGKHPQLKISIVPVGLNYTNPGAFGSSVSIYFGGAMDANEYSADDRVGANRARLDLTGRLSKLITHVEDEDRYEEILTLLEKSRADFLDPSDTNNRIRRILNREKLDIAVDKPPRSIFGNVARIISMAINIVPLVLWWRIENKIQDRVFVGSLKFGFGIFVFPVYYLAFATAIFIATNAIWAMAWLAMAVASILMLRGRSA